VLRGLWSLYGAGSVLHRDGTIERVADPEGVIAAWRRVDEALGTNGLAHLDVLFESMSQR